MQYSFTMMNPRIASMRPYSAARKTQLFSKLTRPVVADLTIGEPQHQPDPRVEQILHEHTAQSLGKYPKTRQESFLTQAIIAAAQASKVIPGDISEGQVLAGCGSGELLFSFVFASLHPDKPYVLIPNPSYQVYSSATELAGGIPYYFNLTRDKGFQPDLTEVPREVLARTSLCFINSPNNPCGVSYSEESLRSLVLLARQHDFALASDECYSELYFSDKPKSVLEICAGLDGRNTFSHVVAFDTLSKRSSLAGLRSGALIGDERLVSNYLKMRLSERKVLPLNVQRASAFAWTNYEDVERNRLLYREKWELARELHRVLGQEELMPDSTFYCWLDISALNEDDEAFSLGLAQETGVLVYPGSYFSVAQHGVNPGRGFIRLALIDTVENTRDTLRVVADFVRNYR